MKKNSPKDESVHVVYKKLGETPLQAISRFKDENPAYKDTPITYAGRLDPMAEGLLLILSGEETKNKENYLNLPKTYQFEILWGLNTDTLDTLGLVQSKNSNLETGVPTEGEVQEYLKNIVGKFEQLYPIYSSRPVNGKSLFEWAREGRINEVNIPKHEVEIFKAKFLERREIGSKELSSQIIERIDLVKGDFRQEEIKEKWNEVLKKETNFILDSVEIEVSSGFYVRQFISDLAGNFKTKAIAFSIKRKSVGEYDLFASHPSK